MSETVVIVGAGHAGGRCALQLRHKGYDGRIILIGEEAHPPYERPALSKEILTNNKDRSALFIVGESQLSEENIDWLGSAVATQIHPQSRQVETDKSGAIPYTKLILATGGRCRALAGLTPDAKHIFELRTLNDAEQLKEKLQPGAKVVIVGGGFIGLEVAASAKSIGCQVSLIESSRALMSRVLPNSIAAAIAGLHINRGVDIHLNEQVKSIDAGGSARQINLTSGAKLIADLILVGVGILPNVDLAQTADIATDQNGSGGILADQYCMTSNPDIYAIGDCAQAFNAHYQTPMRLESWQNAELQAELVADHICGNPRAWQAVPWFWSDQYQFNLQMAGSFSDCDALVERHNKEQKLFLGLSGTELRGAFSMAPKGLGARELRIAQMLIEKRKSVEPAVLADAEVSLKSLLKDTSK